VADGATASAYAITGATPGALITVASPWGTFQGSDASPLYTGFQVPADATGTATFSLVFPRSAGTLTGTITAAEVTGGGAGSVGFTATPGAASYQFDLNGPSNINTAGWVGLRGNTLYSSAATSGFGWTSPVGEFERSGSAFTPVTVYQDGHFGVSPGVFRLATGAAVVDVRVIASDPMTPLRGLSITVEGAGTQRFSPTNFSGVYRFLGAHDTNADGVVDVTLTSSGVWVCNGIEVSQPGMLPAVPQLAGFARPTAVGPVPGLTAVRLAPIVNEAIRRLSVGATAEQVAALRAVRFTIADLDPLGRLGQEGYGVVTLDDDAHGAGWFVDPTPGDDAEFALADAPTQRRAVSGPAAGRVDLLTVVMHELAHEWGWMDRPTAAAPFDLMAETLDTGVRRLPAPAEPAAFNLRVDGEKPASAPAPVVASPPIIAAATTAAAPTTAGQHSMLVVAGFAPPERRASPVWFPDDEVILSGVAVG
jgi:hypothetical protein